ncbi:MAG TPA: glycosyltransferase family A protein [Casimicrobiaceae bacterium]
MDDTPRVDVLIVTLCAPERAASIRRAVDTTLAQEGVRARLVVVVNGGRYDRALYAALTGLAGVDVHYQKEPSIFAARRRAREVVTAPYFGFLDDDDHLLPGALRARVQALATDPAAVAVVSNGCLADGGVEAPVLRDIARIERDPLQSLMQGNWLATASALFRTAAVPPDFFDAAIRSNDMTYVAFRVALAGRVLFLDAPTYRKTYSPDSISLTEEWALPALDTLDRMLAFDMPRAVRRSLRRKWARAAHEISNIYRRRGEAGPAWRFHMRSMREPRGMLAYALYTRRLLFLGRGAPARTKSPPGQ